MDFLNKGTHMKKLILFGLIAFSTVPAAFAQNGGLCGRDRPFGTVIGQAGSCVLCQDLSKHHSYSVHINGSDEIFGTKFPNEARLHFNIMVQQGQCN